jgi:hypothetical protein
MPNNERKLAIGWLIGITAAVLIAIVDAVFNGFTVLVALMSSIAAVMVAVVIVGLRVITRSRDAAVAPKRAQVFSRVGRLLPAEVRDEYCEEWAAWMADLRADGTPRVRRWMELLSLMLIAAPRLAIGLRWAAVRRAVDR